MPEAAGTKSKITIISLEDSAIDMSVIGVKKPLAEKDYQKLYQYFIKNFNYKKEMKRIVVKLVSGSTVYCYPNVADDTTNGRPYCIYMTIRDYYNSYTQHYLQIWLSDKTWRFTS